MLEATRKEKQMQQMGMQEGGITQMQSGGSLGIPGDSLSQSFINPMQQVSDEELNKTKKVLDMLPRNEDGSIDKSEVAKAVAGGLLTATAVAAVLFPEPTTTGLGLARLASTNAGKKILDFGRKLYTKPNPKFSDPSRFKAPNVMQKPLAGNQGVVVTEGTGLVPYVAPRVVSKSRIAGLSSAPLLVGGMLYDEDTLDVDAELPKDGDVNANNAYTDFYKNLFSDDKATTPKKGLGSDDYLRLAQIGGIFGSAKNLGEAATGIGAVAGDIIKARQDARLAENQGDFMKAQIAKIKAEIFNMPIQQTLDTIKQYTALLKAINEGVTQVSNDELNGIKDALTAARTRLSELQGTPVISGSKSYEKYGIKTQ